MGVFVPEYTAPATAAHPTMLAIIIPIMAPTDILSSSADTAKVLVVVTVGDGEGEGDAVGASVVVGAAAVVGASVVVGASGVVVCEGDGGGCEI